MAKNTLNSIESAISKELINNEMSHEDFTTIINEENIRMIKIQKSDVGRNNLIKSGKGISIDEIIK